MRRNVVFGKGSNFRPPRERTRELDLDPRHGAAIGEYSARESSEYSDSYYNPGNEYEHDFGAGDSSRAELDQPAQHSEYVGGVRGVRGRARSMHHISANYRSYGELHPGQKSWADLGVSSVRPGESGITERALESFRGRGPKGYRRSDERLHEIICERLTDDPRVDASEIEVSVKDGEVSLAGTVIDRYTKWRTEEIVAQCAPEAEIQNRLKVSPT